MIKSSELNILINGFRSTTGHRCGREVTLLLLTLRARVRSPVGSFFLVEVFPGFPQLLDKYRENLGPILGYHWPS